MDTNWKPKGDKKKTKREPIGNRERYQKHTDMRYQKETRRKPAGDRKKTEKTKKVTSINPNGNQKETHKDTKKKPERRLKGTNKREHQKETKRKTEGDQRKTEEDHKGN